MVESSMSVFMRLLLLLLLSPQSPDAGRSAGVNLGSAGPENSALFLQLDIDETRRLMRSSEELPTLLAQFADYRPAFEDDRLTSPTGSSTSRIRQILAPQSDFLAERLGLKAQEIQEIASSVRSMGIWIIRVSGPVTDWQYLIVLDHAEKNALLPRVLKPLLHEGGFHLATIGGERAFALGNTSRLLWLMETPGQIAFASDPFTLQAYLDKRKISDNQKPGRTEVDAMLELEVNGTALFGNIHQIVPEDVRRKMLMLSAILDTPSWKHLRLTYDGQRLASEMQFSPESRFAAALRSPLRPPSVLQDFPATSEFAVALGFDDLRTAWSIMLDVSEELRPRSPDVDIAGGLLRIVHESIGLELDRDILSHINSAVLLQRGKWTPDTLLNQGVLILETRNPAVAQMALERWLEWMAGDSKTKPEFREENDVLLFTDGPVLMAMVENKIILAKRGCTYFEPVVERLSLTTPDNSEPSLADYLKLHHETSTSFLKADIPLRNTEGAMTSTTLSVGLNINEEALQLDAKFDIPTLLSALTRWRFSRNQ